MKLAVGNDRQFGRLCDYLGLSELAADPPFETNSARVANRDILIPLLSQALLEHSGFHPRRADSDPDVRRHIGNRSLRARLGAHTEEVFRELEAQEKLKRP